MINLKRNNSIDRYRQVMNSVTVDPDFTRQIIEHCAKYSTLKRMKTKKFRINVAKKEKSTDNV